MSVWSVTQVSSPPAHAVKEKRNVLVSLLTLSNQDREFNNEVALSAHEHTKIRMLPLAALSCDKNCAVMLWRTEVEGQEVSYSNDNTKEMSANKNKKLGKVITAILVLNIFRCLSG